MHANNTTYPQPTPTTIPRIDDLRGGDEVLVYDARSGSLEWFVVMDAVERDRRMKIRIEGANFYFDSSLITDCRINHHIAPRKRNIAPAQEALVAAHDEWDACLFNYGSHADMHSKRTIF